MHRLLQTTLILVLVAALGSATNAEARTASKARAARAKAHKRLCKRIRRKGPRRCRPSKRVHATSSEALPLQSSATTAYATHLSWPIAPGTTTAGVYVDGQLLDRFAARRVDGYDLEGLWPSTAFAVTVELDGAGGQKLARYSRTVTTAPSTTGFPRLFANDAFINTQVAPDASVAPNSQAIVSQAITPYASDASLSNNDTWGIPIVYGAAQSTSYNVGCEYYGCDTAFGHQHIPTSAEPDSGSDGHLVVLQPNGTELDMWTGQHTSGGWTAGSRWVVSTHGPAVDCSVVHTCSGANAADFALAAGVVRPEEIAQGHIDHALAITTPDTRAGYIACPAMGADGHHNDGNAMPIGAHVQLDPSIDVSNLAIPPWQRVIARALQIYGAYVVDTGGTVALEGQSNGGRGYNAWAKAGVPADSPSLSDLPWDSMRVLSMTKCGS